MRAAKLIILITLASLLGLYGLFRYNRPFGVRTCFLPCMVSSLYAYAHEHFGKYPDGPDPYPALQKLYPDLVPNPDLLAGISGDRKATTRVVASGGVLTSNESSWVYIPGLSTTDEEHTILIYERRSGLAFNGTRWPGRAVGFANGSHAQMPEQEFQQLLKAQQDAKTSKQ